MSDFKLVTFKAGQNLFLAGDPADDLFMIQSGEVELLDAKTGKRFATVGPGRSLGEQALVPGGIRGATARAATDISLLKISSEDLSALMQQQSSLLKPLLEALMLQQSMHNAMRIG